MSVDLFKSVVDNKITHMYFTKDANFTWHMSRLGCLGFYGNHHELMCLHLMHHRNYVHQQSLIISIKLSQTRKKCSYGFLLVDFLIKDMLVVYIIIYTLLYMKTIFLNHQVIMLLNKLTPGYIWSFINGIIALLFQSPTNIFKF